MIIRHVIEKKEVGTTGRTNIKLKLWKFIRQQRSKPTKPPFFLL